MEQLSISEKEIKVCAFTGHREIREDISAAKLLKEVKKAVKEGVEIFYTGMARGFDLLAAETVLALKERFPSVKLVACVPFYGQEQNFSQKDKKRYVEILKRSDEKIVLSEKYYRGCMHVRNRYMADRADMLIVYCRKEKSGTSSTVNYFKKICPGGKIEFL